MAERVAQSTDYVVLVRRELKDDDGGAVVAWVETGGVITSASRIAAATQAAQDQEGVWRPVPMRSWQNPIRTFAETTTKIRVEVVEDQPDF